MAKAGNTGGKIVGYGAGGKPFRDQTKYNVSVSGQRHAQNPNLSTKPVGYGKKGNAFFSKAKLNAATGSGHNGSNPSVPKTPSHYHGQTSGATPMKGAAPGRVARVPRMK